MSRRGFTLIELLITVAVGALVLSFALPSFQRLLARERSAAAMNQMLGAVAMARTEAILHRRIITLCPGHTGRCLGRNEWHQGALLFVDDNGNGRVDGSDRITAAVPALRPGERIYWRSFRNRSYLQFQPRGFTRWQNGNFLYCPPENQAELARMAIINAQGRVRLARDSDGDGVIEGAGGKAVVCPP